MKISGRNILALYPLIFTLFVVPVLRASSQDTSRIRLIFAGDIMGHDSQIQAAFIPDSDRYDYHSCFALLKPYLEQADITVGNLEVTLAGPPYKGYPQFSSPDELAGALKEAGFDVLLNANNHALDRGKEGLGRTLSVLSGKGLIYSGSFTSGTDRDQRYPLLIEKNNILLAILNYTYGTNELKPDTPNIVNYTDTVMIREDIRKAQLAQPDFMIACMHWGREYERTPHHSQLELADFLFRNGVNAIIGSHPHVIQPVCLHYPVKDSPRFSLVVYSLGNMVSNQRSRYQDGGILFELELVKSGRTTVHRYSWLPVWVNKPVVGGKTTFQLVPAGIGREYMDSLNISETDQEKYYQFYNDTRDHLQDIPENRFYLESFSR